MAHGIPNEEWTEKIKDIGLKGSAKVHKGDPFKGVLMSGSTSKGTDAVRKRSFRSDMFGYISSEWDICLEMVELRRSGNTYGQIAKYLNDKSITTKVGRQWNYFTARFVTLRTVQALSLKDTESKYIEVLDIN
tara:strand:- start:154 stop:552 length:399 start_codon:yes stop_codon:yes gene_type:complete